MDSSNSSSRPPNSTFRGRGRGRGRGGKAVPVPKVKVPKPKKQPLNEQLLLSETGLDDLNSRFNVLAPTLSGQPDHCLKDMVSIIRTVQDWCGKMIPASTFETELYLYRISKLGAKNDIKSRLHSYTSSEQYEADPIRDEQEFFDIPSD
ncbi:hypothetical protein RCL1_005972 [Eukaryota sp. TZLM3-RCL]